MTIEEKAKRYDEAFGIARNVWRFSSNNAEIMRMEELFPELAKSEDERIKKAIKYGLDYVFTNNTTVYETTKEQCLAWLEKQVEQKSADKVEPKFHEGDWVVFNNHHDLVFQVEKIENYEYTLRHFLGVSITLPFSHEDIIRAWTIQDAKDGDVLDANGAPFIYKRHDEDYVYFYCGVNLADEFIEANGIDTWNSSNKVYPATKEQRDTLMKAMTDAGLEFDFEKKVLKKIEQKSQRMVSAEAKEALYDKPTDEEMKELLRTEYEKGRADTIAEMEKDWSEEDIRNIQDIDSILFYEKDLPEDTCMRLRNWLQSLKPNKDMIEALRTE